MKVNELKNIIKQSVKEAIQEELKEILLEAVKSPKQVVQPQTPSPIDSKTKEQLRESYKNVLGSTAANFNSSMVGKPLQMSGPMDTTSPNGKLPEGEVSMDQIMGLMSGK